jgi:hypothetical protein
VPTPFFDFTDMPRLTSADRLYGALKDAGFPTPSVIQAQAWPAAVEGRDVIGVAKTGSGKTLGFLVPAFLNIINQTWGHRDPRYGPIALVLAPTRELATQIEEECVKFGRSSGVYVAPSMSPPPTARGPRDVLSFSAFRHSGPDRALVLRIARVVGSQRAAMVAHQSTHSFGRSGTGCRLSRQHPAA